MPLCSQEVKTFQHHQEKVSCFSHSWNPLEGWGGKTGHNCNVRSYFYPLNPLQHRTSLLMVKWVVCMWIAGSDVKGQGGGACQCHMSNLHHRWFGKLVSQRLQKPKVRFRCPTTIPVYVYCLVNVLLTFIVDFNIVFCFCFLSNLEVQEEIISPQLDATSLKECLKRYRHATAFILFESM